MAEYSLRIVAATQDGACHLNGQSEGREGGDTVSHSVHLLMHDGRLPLTRCHLLDGKAKLIRLRECP